jgi:archaemetzincin
LSKQSILLISHGNFEIDFIEKIAREIARVFSSPVSIEISHIDLSEFYDPLRRQYNANSILNSIDYRSPEVNLKNIGLFKVDLFIPILTYIFGQAALNGSSGIASQYRLRNEHYGIKKDENLLLERFTKVIIHELGHMFGLIHCQNPICVMRSSTYVEDIDQKNQNFCIPCRSSIAHLSPGDFI